ncbi:MAG: T9SS type A sorting domain-containing protein [Ignavibacteriaceae bacterium]
MNKSFYTIFILGLFVCLGGFTFAQEAQDVADPSGVAVTLDQVTTPFEYDAAVLFDNGPIITLPGGGCSGGDASILDGTIGGHTLYGWNVNSAAAPGTNYYIADDFTSTEEWTIDSMKFFAYQTGAVSSTLTGVYVQIWNGAPNAGGTIVWGDLITNRLQSTALTNIYRAQSTTPTNCDRRVQEISATINTVLPAGQYWVQWGITGSAASGPWQPPVTIAGVAVTGDALQATPTGWVQALNGTTSQNGAPFIVYGSAGGGGYSFFDNFDSYVAGQLLAQQNPTEWTTWDNNPGGAADALVSNAFSASNPNSVVILPNDDLVRLHGDLTSGKWYTGFLMYIPTGKAGYWNMLSDFTFNTGGYWAFECYFDVGGGGRLLTGDGTTIFNWTPNTWQWVEVVIDLDLDQTEFWIGGSVGGTLVHSWAWTNGTSTGLGPLVIDATDFFGATANDEMYFDNYFIGPQTITPVELTSFGANVNAAGNVVLNWTTATEVNNQMFEVERRVEGSDFYRIGYVDGKGTTSEAQEYSYIDNSVTTGTYYYRLKQIDFNGTFEYSNEVMVDVKGPLGYNLVQNYPNPFNPSTRIDFNIAEPTMVRLAVYNLLGEEVQVLRNEFMQPGFYNVNFDASNLPSGMYIYKLETASYTQARKMMLMK